MSSMLQPYYDVETLELVSLLCMLLPNSNVATSSPNVTTFIFLL